MLQDWFYRILNALFLTKCSLKMWKRVHIFLICQMRFSWNVMYCCFSNTCEIIIFLFLGLKTVHPNHSWNTGFVLWTLFFCVLYRFISKSYYFMSWSFLCFMKYFRIQISIKALLETLQCIFKWKLLHVCIHIHVISIYIKLLSRKRVSLDNQV